MKVTHFKSSSEFRQWLEKNGSTATEVWVGFYKVDSGKTGITYREALDEALCYGWIDGIRKRVDELSYTNRFTPRKAVSNWSAVNTRRFEELQKLGRVKPPGLKAFEARDPRKTAIFAVENRPTSFTAEHTRQFKADTKAWEFFQSQPDGYRRLAIWFVMSAKRDETRQKRIDVLIDLCRKGRRLEPMGGKKK